MLGTRLALLPFLFLRKGHYPVAHFGRFPPRRSSTLNEVTEMLVFNLEILAGKIDVKGILITKHWKEEIINNILQSDGELTHRKEECVERRTPMAHQVSKALDVPKTFKIPRNRYWFQDPNVLQTTYKLTIRTLPIHPTGPMSNLL